MNDSNEKEFINVKCGDIDLAAIRRFIGKPIDCNITISIANYESKTLSIRHHSLTNKLFNNHEAIMFFAFLLFFSVNLMNVIKLQNRKYLAKTGSIQTKQEATNQNTNYLIKTGSSQSKPESKTGNIESKQRTTNENRKYSTKTGSTQSKSQSKQEVFN